MDEVLGHMIQSALAACSLKGLSLHNAPPLAYQQFVDDNLLFGHSSIHESPTIHSILQTFEDALGTTLNMEKSQKKISILVLQPRETSLVSSASQSPPCLLNIWGLLCSMKLLNTHLGRNS